jgi:hypothetical protein
VKGTKIKMQGSSAQKIQKGKKIKKSFINIIFFYLIIKKYQKARFEDKMTGIITFFIRRI